MPGRRRARRHPHKGHRLSAATRRKLSLERRGRHHPHRGVHGRRHSRHRAHKAKVKVVHVTRHKGRSARHHALSVRKLMHLLTRHRLRKSRDLKRPRHRRTRVFRRIGRTHVSKG